MGDKRVAGGAPRVGDPQRRPVAPRRGRRLGAALVLLASAALAVPAGGAANQPCTGEYNYKPLSRAAPGPPPLLIGTSVTGFAVPELRTAGFRLNWQACRTFGRAVRTLERRKSRSRPIPRLVIIEAGTLGPVRIGQIRRARRILGKGHLLGLVTPRKPNTGRDLPAGELMRKAARRLKRVILIDWVRWSANHPEWFYGDQVHPNEEGAEAYAELLARRAFRPARGRG